MIFGPTLTPQAEQAWVFSNAAKVVSFGTSLTATHLTKIGPYTFRNAVTEDIMTPQSIRAAVAKLRREERVAAIFQDDDSFAQGAYFAATPAIMKEKATHGGARALHRQEQGFRGAHRAHQGEAARRRSTSPVARRRGGRDHDRGEEAGPRGAGDRQQQLRVARALRAGEGFRQQRRVHHPVVGGIRVQAQPGLHGQVRGPVPAQAQPLLGPRLRRALHRGRGAEEGPLVHGRRHGTHRAARRADRA